MIQYIQMLRFGAAMWVAVYHAKNADFFPALPHWLQLLVAGGYAGVDIFFVISGVIMALSTQNTPAGPRAASQFVLTRFARIYTGWWPAMLVFYVVLRSLNALPPHVDMVASTWLYPSNFTHHISAVIWSLVFELYFYLLIGLSLLLPPKRRDVAMATLAAAMLGICVYFYTQGRFAPERFGEATTLMWFYASPLVLEFFAGYFLYRLLHRYPRQDWRLWLIATALLAGYAAYFALNKAVYEPGLAGFFHWPERALFIGSAACALVGTALLLPQPRTATMQRLAHWGDYSYAIYLLHPLVLVAIGHGLHQLNLANPHRGVTTLVALLLIFLVSAAYYRFVEHPLYQACRRHINQWFTPRP